MTHLPNGAPIAAIPEALRRRPQWVLWRLDPKPEKPDELTKVPYTDLKRKALANKPQTWLPFDEALRRWAANPNGWAGIGYEFSADDPYTGIDLDNCLDPATGRVEPWADLELAQLLPTYAEVSPSGRGIKLWVETEQAHTLGSSDKDAGQVEIYSSGRFFAVTGLTFEDAPPTIAHADDALIEAIIAHEQERRRARRPQPTPHTNGAHKSAANGTRPPLPLPDLTRVLDRLHADRWASYDDWVRIGMALHHWAGGDAHRAATAYALFDQYSKERAPGMYGETAEKWASFGKRNGQAPDVTVGTLIQWTKEDSDSAQAAEPPIDDAPHPADVAAADDEPDEPSIALAPASSFPELPEAARLPEERGKDACPWLDEYTAFSRRWSPRSYEGFHEGCGLWLLSTIAARRVMLPLGGEKFTNLYIALCARTSLWAKSTAAKIAIDTIRAAGLTPLLAPDDATPQAFIKRLAEQLPADWGNLSEQLQEAERMRMAFAGQRGWFFEEFGEKLAAMMRDGNVMADYRGHFRRFDDCPASYSYSTIGRGMNTVERPYLALLANLTPADLAPFARKGSSLWGDGFFARYAFVTPPAGAERSRARFPGGWREIPVSLLEPLRTWHKQLGIPEVEIEERLDDKGKPTGSYSLAVTPIAPQRCTLGAGVYDAFYRYHDALTDLIDAGDNTDLDGSYTRFADKALRIAMLLASFSNGGRIELRHWARAQAIAERWRRALHNLIDQLGQSEDSPERVLEDKISRLFARYEALTARDAGRYLHISTGEAERILDQMARAGELNVEKGKRTKRYRRPAASVASVTPSHTSQPAKIRDTSADTPIGIVEVSQELEGCDTMTYVTVATPPKEADADAPDGDWGSDDDQAALARELAATGYQERAQWVAGNIQDATYRADVEREIAPLAADLSSGLRLLKIAPALYAAGWRVAKKGADYVVFHPDGRRTGAYGDLAAAARAAAELDAADLPIAA